ncbi:MAG TPA: hypothetical protein VN947_05425 [Polyangia bacterium]|nr:hypothetical protein [Polyangia bacterium]
MAVSIDLPDRQRLEELAVELREAIFGALERRWLLAQALDETRSEIERLLMMDVIERAEARRAITRAEVMLDASSGLSGTARSR